MIKILPHPDKAKEVIDILRSMKGFTRVSPGCIECSIAREEDDVSWIVYVEHWCSWEDLQCHMRSKIYRRLLETLELSCVPPAISFFQTSEVKGMEFIVAALAHESAQA
jgi:quinol monooxygenase YgiN